MAAKDNPTIGIIGGKGRMGRLFAEFFKDQGTQILISDIGTKLTNQQLAVKSDIVIVSVPIDQTKKVIKEVIKFIRPTAALMDFTSIKEMPVKAMLKGKCEVLGMHPMFGNSNPIPGQTIILCPTKKSGKWAKWIENFFRNNGVKIEKMTPTEHDKIMNIAQGLIHFAEITFADALRRCQLPIKQLLQYTGKASELKIQLAARIIAQDAGLYSNIQIENPYALKSLSEYKKSIDELMKIVKDKDSRAFQNYFDKNKKYFGEYKDEAYNDSSILIDKLLELQNPDRRSGLSKNVRPKDGHLIPSKNNLAVLGPKNTFSDLAADKYLTGSHLRLQKYFAHDIDEIFDLVEKWTVAEGLVPIENKLNGSVRETLDALFVKNVHIVNEIALPIHHCLITLSHAKKDDLTTIISHPQALSQCKKYLQKNFRKVDFEETASTTAAVEKLLFSNDKSIAVIAPEIAANNPKLKISVKNIEDEHDNTTTFIVIRRGKSQFANKNIIHAAHAAKTSIAFYFSADAPGSLFTVFRDFAEAKINLSKIESRPTKKRFGDYIFYLDFAGHISDLNIQKTLKTVSQKVAGLKVLGSY